MIEIFKLTNRKNGESIDLPETYIIDILKILRYRNKELYHLIKFKYEILIQKNITDEEIKKL